MQPQNQYVITLHGLKRNYYAPNYMMKIRRIRVVENYIDIEKQIQEMSEGLKEVLSVDCERFRTLEDMNNDRAREIINL